MDLQPKLVFAAHTNRDYEGDVKNGGDQVRILAPGKPTIYTASVSSTATGGSGSTVATKVLLDSDLPTAERIDNTEALLQINKVSYFNYIVGDIDQQLASKKNLVSMYREEALNELAQAMDEYIASIMADSTAIAFDPKWYNSSASAIKVIASGTAVTATSGEIHPCDLIDLAVQKLNENDVDDSTPLVAEVSPKFWRYLKEQYRDLDTDNSLILSGRRLGKYNDVLIKKSNVCVGAATASATDEYVFIHTERAVAFVNPLAITEAYRPEKGFADAVKGMIYYDGKVIRSKEAFAIKVTY
jgi:hypothetical protein